MASSEAQRSPVHHATEDSNAEPTGPSSAASPKPGVDARNPGAGTRPDDASKRDDPDESTFGGPLKIDDPDAPQ